MSVAKKLRAWMAAHDMGPTEFARLVGVTHPTASDWASGKKMPKRANAIVIERKTGGAITRVDCGYAPASE